MKNIKYTLFPMNDSIENNVDFVLKCLNARPEIVNRLKSLLKEWNLVVCPRIIRVSDTNFDQALIVPYEKGSESDQKDENHFKWKDNNYFGLVFAIVNRNPQETVVDLQLPNRKQLNSVNFNRLTAEQVSYQLKELSNFSNKDNISSVDMNDTRSSITLWIKTQVKIAVTQAFDEYFSTHSAKDLKFPYSIQLRIGRNYYDETDSEDIPCYFSRISSDKNEYQTGYHLANTTKQTESIYNNLPQALENPEEWDGIIIPKGKPVGSWVTSLNSKAIVNYLSDVIVNNITVAWNQAKKLALKEFNTKLNPNLLTLAKRTPYSGSIYNWLQGDQNILNSIHREQALKEFPMFLTEIKMYEKEHRTKTQLKNKIHDRYRFRGDLSKEITTDQLETFTIDQQIDNGHSLTELLEEKSGLPYYIVRSFKGVEYHDLKDIEGNNIGLSFKDNLNIIKYLDKIVPQDFWPTVQTNFSLGEQWKQLYVVLSAVKYWTKAITEVGYIDYDNTVLFTDVSRMISNGGAFWKKQASVVIGSSDIFIARDMISDFRRQLLYPLIYDAGIVQLENQNDQQEYIDFDLGCKLLVQSYDSNFSVLEQALTGTRSIKKILELSKQWHEKYDRINNSIVYEDDQRDWLPLFEPVKINSLTAVPLFTAQELLNEGKRLQHCVGSYVSQCFNSRCHIVSLRDDNGTSVSTVELKFQNKDEQIVKIVQNLSFKNSKPSQEAEQAGLELVNSINDKQIKVDFDQIEQALLSRRSGNKYIREKVSEYIGYDVESQTARTAALQAWSFAIPRSLRNLNYSEWANQLSLIEILQAVYGSDPNNKKNFNNQNTNEENQNLLKM